MPVASGRGAQADGGRRPPAGANAPGLAEHFAVPSDGRATFTHVHESRTLSRRRLVGESWPAYYGRITDEQARQAEQLTVFDALAELARDRMLLTADLASKSDAGR